MRKFFEELCRNPRKVPRYEQYGVVLITENPEQEALVFHDEIKAMMKYPHIVKTHHISLADAKKAVPELGISREPMMMVVREGIDSHRSLHHNLARRLQLLSVSESWRGIAFSPFYIKLNFH